MEHASHSFLRYLKIHMYLPFEDSEYRTCVRESFYDLDIRSTDLLKPVGIRMSLEMIVYVERSTLREYSECLYYIVDSK